MLARGKSCSEIVTGSQAALCSHGCFILRLNICGHIAASFLKRPLNRCTSCCCNTLRAPSRSDQCVARPGRQQGCCGRCPGQTGGKDAMAGGNGAEVSCGRIRRWDDSVELNGLLLVQTRLFSPRRKHHTWPSSYVSLVSPIRTHATQTKCASYFPCLVARWRHWW